MSKLFRKIINYIDMIKNKNYYEEEDSLLSEFERDEFLRDLNENKFTADYPLGGMLEPYDIERDKEFLR